MSTAALCRSASASELHDVLYFDWTADLHLALQHLQLVKGTIPTSETPVEVVRQGDAYGVVARAGGAPEDVARLAASHDGLLRAEVDSDAALAGGVARGDYQRVYNVSYGLGPNLDPLVEAFDVVAATLGEGVARRLVIERTDHGNYALVYKRYGELDATRAAAARHAKLLKSVRVGASFIQEQAFPVLFDATSDPDELVELPVLLGEAEPPEPVPTPPAPRPPAPVAPAPPDRPRKGTGDLLAGSSSLRDAINAHVQDLRKRRRIASDERTAWLVYDLEADVTVAAINEDVSMQAASMIKPLVMLAFMDQVKRGRLIYGRASQAKLASMIQYSSNSATNWAMDHAGGPSGVQAILNARYGHLCRNVSVVERIASNGRTYRNKASAADYGRYLRALWNDELPFAKEQFRLLNLPGSDRLYHGVPAIPHGTRVYNKTGSTARCCGDMGVLLMRAGDGRRVPYIVVGIVDKSSRASNYGSWIGARGNVVRAVSGLAYDAMSRRYA